MVKTYCENPLLISELKHQMDIHSLRTHILDDKSLEVLLRIEQKLSILEPMGCDDCRYLYLEAVRGTFEQWLEIEGEEPDSATARCNLRDYWTNEFPEDKEWFEVGVARFENQVRIYIVDMFNNSYVLTNTRNVYTPRERDASVRYDHYELLCNLEHYLGGIVDKIIEDPKSYMDYIEQYYPYQNRKGTVSMQHWCQILGRKLVDLDDKAVELLKKLISITQPCYDGPMTLREYMKVWKVAYCGISNDEYLKKLSPEEVFERSSKGHKDVIEKYDLDSKKDFILWCKENAAYHCFDLTYVCVHLLPAPKGSKWRPILSAAHEWAINEMMSAAKALSAAGIPFVIPQAREILKMHEMTGNIIIDSDYCDRSRIGEIVRRLPEAGYDNVTKYQVEELIRIIKWDNLKEVKLCKIKH